MSISSIGNNPMTQPPLQTPSNETGGGGGQTEPPIEGTSSTITTLTGGGGGQTEPPVEDEDSNAIDGTNVNIVV